MSALSRKQPFALMRQTAVHGRQENVRFSPLERRGEVVQSVGACTSVVCNGSSTNPLAAKQTYPRDKLPKF
jgi:hypothetical protein